MIMDSELCCLDATPPGDITPLDADSTAKIEFSKQNPCHAPSPVCYLGDLWVSRRTDFSHPAIT